MAKNSTFDFSNLGKNPTPLLVALLVVGAFIIGTLFTKVSYLEKGGTPSTATTGTGTTTGAQPAATPAPGQKVDVSVGKLPTLGSKDAKVTVIEFADFQCPFCEKWFKDVEPSLKKDYIDSGKVQFVFRHYAFLGQESTWAAEASECANEQGKFWEYHDYLFNHQGAENSGAFSKANLEGFAAVLGLDTQKFNPCLETDKYATNVSTDFTEGQKAGVSGTPATFINGLISVGAQPYATFKTLIDAELAK